MKASWCAATCALVAHDIGLLCADVALLLLVDVHRQMDLSRDSSAKPPDCWSTQQSRIHMIRGKTCRTEHLVRDELVANG